VHRAALSTLAAVCSAGILLTACQNPVASVFGTGAPGAPLAVGEEVKIDFFTNAMKLDTGVELEAGSAYALRIATLSNWIDLDIEANEAGGKLDERGFGNSLMRWEWMGYLRRSREHNWFELMLHQPACPRASLVGVSELAFDAASGEYRFTATCDGKLALFVNDSVGRYGDNAGYANISLSRLD